MADPDEFYHDFMRASSGGYNNGSLGSEVGASSRPVVAPPTRTVSPQPVQSTVRGSGGSASTGHVGSAYQPSAIERWWDAVVEKVTTLFERYFEIFSAPFEYVASLGEKLEEVESKVRLPCLIVVSVLITFKVMFFPGEAGGFWLGCRALIAPAGMFAALIPLGVGALLGWYLPNIGGRAIYGAFSLLAGVAIFAAALLLIAFIYLPIALWQHWIPFS